MNRKNTKALTLLLSLTILFSVLLSGCGETKNGDMQKVVLNEVAHSIFYAPMYVAIEEGYFA